MFNQGEAGFRGDDVLASLDCVTVIDSGCHPDDWLVESVVEVLERMSTYPDSIEVELCDGVVTLRGSVHAREMVGMVRAVAALEGVRGVVNHLHAVPMSLIHS